MIIVTGISGVGKTFTIRAFVARQPTYRYFRASQILVEHGLPIKDLTMEQVARNQNAIIAALSRISKDSGRRLIVDGHAIIETMDGPIRATASIYNGLSISGIVTIVDSPDELRIRRSTKPIPSRGVDVSQLQALEISVSATWAAELGVDFAEVRSGDLAAFSFALERFSRQVQQSDR